MFSLFNKCRTFIATWDLIEYLELQDDAVAVKYPQINAPELKGYTRKDLAVPEFWLGFSVYESYSDSDKEKFFGIFDNWCDSKRSCTSSKIDGRNMNFQLFSVLYLQEVLVALDMLITYGFESDERYQQYKIPSFGEDMAGMLSLPVDDLLDSLTVPPELAPLLPFEIMFSTVRPMYELLLSSFGYEHRSTIPAYYLLTYIDTKSIIRLIKLSSQNSNSVPGEALSLLKGGFSGMFEELAKKDDIEVQTLSEVVDISAGRRGGFTVRSKDNNVFSRGQTSSDNFDFVISAIDAAKFSSLIQGVDTSDVDAAMSCTIKTTWRVSRARITFNEENPKAGVINMPIVTAAANDSEGKVRGALSVISMPMAKNGATQEEYTNTMERDAVLYETNFDPSISQFEAFDGLDWLTVDEVYEEVIHPTYFVRSLDFETCSPWQVLPGQGKDNVWYIGGSVTFEGVESILQYNQMIVDKFCADSSNCTD